MCKISDHYAMIHVQLSIPSRMRSVRIMFMHLSMFSDCWTQPHLTKIGLCLHQSVIIVFAGFLCVCIYIVTLLIITMLAVAS